MRRGSRGVVSLEALLALGPLLLTFLALCQLALAYLGRLVVQHAATRAARAAAVVLDDAPEHYGGAPRGDLRAGSPGEGPLTRLPLGGGGAGPSQSATGAGLLGLGGGEAEGGARLVAIGRAAHAPLAVLSPSARELLGRAHLADAVGGGALERLALGALVYAPAMTAVTLHEPGAAPAEHEGASLFSFWQSPPADAGLSEVEPGAAVEVRVTFAFPCRVPLAAALLCRRGTALLLGGEAAALAAAERPSLQKLLLADGYYLLLSGVAVTPNHSARYHSEDA
jgi:hypothetical protein